MRYTVNKHELIELFKNNDIPNVCDTHTGSIYNLKRMIVIVLPDGKEVQGMIYSNDCGIYCRSLEDFKDFDVV